MTKGLKALSLVDIGSPDVSEHRFAQRAVTKRKPIEPPLKLAQAPEMNEEWSSMVICIAQLFDLNRSTEHVELDPTFSLTNEKKGSSEPFPGRRKTA